MCVTQHARTAGYTPPRRAAALRGLVGSVLGFDAASQFAFSVKNFFSGSTGLNPSQVKF